MQAVFLRLRACVLYANHLPGTSRSRSKTLCGVRVALACTVSWLLALVLAASFPAHAASFTAAGAFPAAIPDNNATGISRTFNVSGATGTLTSISVAVGLTHPFAGDVRLRLEAPNGTGFDLVNRIGQTGSGFGDNSNYGTTYTFVDENFAGAGDIWAAAAGVNAGAVIPGGNYRTTGSGSSAATNLLAAFSGLSVGQINGNWSLQAYDLAPGDIGSVTSAVLTLTFAKANQTITFNTQSGQTYSPGGTFNINPVATASSGLAVSYAVGPNTVCTLGSGTTVNIVGAGTCTITASQAGNANYNAATPVAQNVTIAKANQTITFGAQPGQTYSPGGTFNISPVATASSGLAVSYAVSPNTVCTLGSGTTVNIVGAGTCTITASQAGDGNYNAATPVAQNVTIAKAAQTLTFPAQTPARRTFVDGGTFSINPVATSASPNSGSAIAYSSLTPLVCTVSGTTVSMLKPGTCTLAADQAGDSNYLDAPQVTQDVVIVPAPTAIPTLGEWGLMLMGLLAAGLGARRLRRL